MMPFQIIRNNIAAVEADAIVNTANPRPVIGSGTDAAIHHKAGPRRLEAREKIGAIPVGQYARQSERFVAEQFHGSLPAFLAAFTGRKQLSPEEVSALRRMIEDYEEG